MSLLYTQEPNGIWRKRTTALDHYAPEFLVRAAAFWRDPRVGDRYFANSGSRSYAKQLALWVLYKAGGALAAKPGISNHEYGSANHPLTTAMDVNPMGSGTYSQLHSIAFEYGFHFPIPSELWHMEMRPGRGAIPHTETTYQAPEEEEELPKYTDKFTWPDGHQVQIFANGTIECFGAKSYGSMHDLRDNAKVGFVELHAVGPVNPTDSQAGYIAYDQRGGEGFGFKPGVEKFFK